MRVAIILATVLAALGLVTREVQGAPGTRPDCVTMALAFSETIEPVIEAVIDGRSAAVPREARRAQAWWADHRTQLADTSAIEDAMGDFQRQVAGSRPLLAARAAINASSTALDACSAPPNAASRLARIDLCGMAGWLRAHGVSMDYPRDVAESAQAISAALRGGGHAALANRLVADVAATLATSVSAHGDVRAANRLLACVDEVERVAH